MGILYPLHTTTNEADSAYVCESKRGYSIHGLNIAFTWNGIVNEAIYIEKISHLTYIPTIKIEKKNNNVRFNLNIYYRLLQMKRKIPI